MITGIVREVASENTGYAYDGLDRLVSSTSSYMTASYGWDLTGNPTQRVDNASTSTYNLGIGNRLAAWTGGGYLHDAAGCVTNIARGSTNLWPAWDGQYRLSGISGSGVSVEFRYDALGRRVKSVEDGVTTWHVYDGPHVVADLDADGNLLRSYQQGPGVDNWLAMTVHTGATPRTYYFLTDHLGTVHALADDAGAVVEQYRYDPWGRVLGVWDGAGNPLMQSAVGNRILWQGREYSWNTGLYYFRARWYDPITGRWLSNDPIGISGGLNQYVFCGDDPIDGVDPTGLDWLSYNGTKLIWYGGNVGDTTRVVDTYKATSGLKSVGQTPDQQSTAYGPIPEGEYTANIRLDPKPATINKDTRQYDPGWGYQTLPVESEDWGTQRIALTPTFKLPKGRSGGFYLHDSHKGESHGCVETEPGFFERLMEYKKSNSKSLHLVVKYVGKTTNGGTER